MYVVKLMRSGYSLRVSIPRDVQRHLRVARGDVLVLELVGGGRIQAWKLDPGALRPARVPDAPD